MKNVIGFVDQIAIPAIGPFLLCTFINHFTLKDLSLFLLSFFLN